MNELERSLLELEVEWPATPDLAAVVTARIAAQPRAGAPAEGAGGEIRPPGEAGLGGRGEPAAGAPRSRRGRPTRAAGAGWRARVAYVAAALVVLAGGTLAVSPEARSTALRWLGLSSVEIRREPLRPGVGRDLGLGEPIDLPPGTPVPERLGTPDAVYATRLPDGTTAASLVYGGPPRVLVQTFRATVRPFIHKTVGSGADVEPLTLDGARAYWITNAHGFAFESSAGGAYEDQRLSDRVLLVERDGLLIRVEGALDRDRAMAIARSVQ